ncbi:MAG: hypothetical protein KDB79_16170 [Acidobacteria bacterium]|nr:hypothetical protein [Acidobacteriota bacterium]
MKMDSQQVIFAGQKGSASVKLALVLVFIFLVGNAGFNYVPVAYQGEGLKTDLHAAVLQGMAVIRGEKPTEKVKKYVEAAVARNGAPENTYIKVQEVKNVVQANVQYTKRVNILPFGIYQYDYVFNETVTPSGILFN